MLGAPVGANINTQSIWDGLIEKMRKRFLFWRTRDLTMQGKAYIAASLGLSQTSYLMDLKDLDTPVLDKIDTLCDNFYGKGKDQK